MCGMLCEGPFIGRSWVSMRPMFQLTSAWLLATVLRKDPTHTPSAQALKDMQEARARAERDAAVHAQVSCACLASSWLCLFPLLLSFSFLFLSVALVGLFVESGREGEFLY